MSVLVYTPRFAVGRLVSTTGAIDSLIADDVVRALARHLSGDWGDLDEHDWKSNDHALEFGGRILSQYFDQDGTKFWIITECDRSTTTILLPEEY